MIMLILAPLVGVLGALLLAYGAWLIYPKKKPSWITGRTLTAT